MTGVLLFVILLLALNLSSAVSIFNRPKVLAKSYKTDGTSSPILEPSTTSLAPDYETTTSDSNSTLDQAEVKNIEQPRPASVSNDFSKDIDNIADALSRLIKSDDDSAKNAAGNGTGNGTDCEKGKEVSSSYSPYCDLVKSYYVLEHHENNREGLSVIFELKKSFSHDQQIRHYVIRAARIISSDNIAETRFNLIPWNQKISHSIIIIDNLKEGQYNVQICAITAGFTPSFVDNEKFSWARDAKTHTLKLQAPPQKVDEKVKDTANDAMMIHW